ncbi:MAG: hypothetical protein NVSMB18_13320 [Acetobacteraceae bacterium]
MFVSGVRQAVPARARGVRTGAAASAFHLPDGGAGTAESMVGATAVAMPSLLAMQEAESDALQDRDARRHGTAVIDELSGLQCSLLGGDAPDLGKLASLAQRPVAAADPRLAGVLRAIQLRAQIELARHGAAASR